MAIILRLDRVMADRKISLNELSKKVGISNVNLSNLKTGKVKAIRFSTLTAICEVLDCQPGDILEYDKLLPSKNVLYMCEFVKLHPTNLQFLNTTLTKLHSLKSVFEKSQLSNTTSVNDT